MSNVRRQERHSVLFRILATLFGLLLSAPVSATGDMRPILLVLVSNTCLAQDPALRSSPFAKSLERAVEPEPASAYWEQFDKTDAARCARDEKWIPAAMCASAVELDLQSTKAADAWFSTYAAELQSLKPVFDAMSKGRMKPGACKPL
jgi:hypothetical protein